MTQRVSNQHHSTPLRLKLSHAYKRCGVADSLYVGEVMNTDLKREELTPPEQRFLFLNAAPDVGPQKHILYSHAARRTHRWRRRRRKQQQQEELEYQSPPQQVHDQHGSLISTTSVNRVTYADQSEQGNPLIPDSATTQVGRVVFKMPQSTLLGLGPNASPDAVGTGYKYIGFYTDVEAKRDALVYPAFSLSTIPSMDWPMILTDRLVFNAAAAWVMAATHDLKEGKIPPEHLMLYRNTLQHRQKTLQELGLHLKDVMADSIVFDPALLVGITLLALLDQYLGQVESWRMHRQTIGKLINGAGGLDKLEYHPDMTLPAKLKWPGPWKLDFLF